MPRTNRTVAMPADEIGVFHCFNRCVQQMTLCGRDPLSGEDCSSRKIWMTEMLEELAGGFALDIMSYCFMDNHYHMILRNRPDLVVGYDNIEVAKRWWKLCPEIRGTDGRAVEPDLNDLRIWIDDPDVIGELRGRLTNITWLMQLFNARIARRANAEAGRKGHFFEGRFKSKRLLDEASIIACSLYVDLNPIRAALAKTPEQAVFTSVNDRIVSRGERLARALPIGCTGEMLTSLNGLSLDVLAADPNSADAFLAPLTLEAEKRMKTHLQTSFPEAGPIAWEAMEELRKNAANACDGSLKRLQHLMIHGNADFRMESLEDKAAEVMNEVESTHLEQQQGADAMPTCGDHIDSSSVGTSAKQIISSSSAIAKRPRPWQEGRKNTTQAADRTSTSIDNAYRSLAAQPPESSHSTVGSTDSHFLDFHEPTEAEFTEAGSDSHDAGDGKLIEPDCSPPELVANRADRKRVKVPKLNVPRKHHKSKAQRQTPDSAKSTPTGSPGIHWLDARGEAGLRSDPDDLSTRLAFPSTRASNKGFMSLTLNEYLELLDWTGRRIVPDKPGSIPECEPPVLARLGIKADGFIALIREMGELDGVALGSVAAMASEALRIGRKWLHHSRRLEDVVS